MFSIRYFDLRYVPINIATRGENIEISELIKRTKHLYAEVFELSDNLINDIEEIYKIDFKKSETKGWKKLFSSVVFAVSGHIPTNDDMKNILRSFQGLRTSLLKKNPEIKKIIDTPEFVFGSIPYLCCGFVLKDFNYNSDGKNSIESAVKIYNKLIIEKSSSILTVLCAHRESKENDRGGIVEEVDYKSLDKMINLVVGLILNIPECATRQYVWKMLQPTGNAESVLSLFPNVILRYVNKGELSKLLATLDRHVDVTKKYLSTVSETISNFSFLIDSTEILYKKIHNVNNTQLMDLEDIDEPHLLSQKIAYISKKDTFKDMHRIVSNFEDLKVIDSAVEVLNIDNSGEFKKEVLKAFLLIKKQNNLFLKSMFETWFYYFISVLAQKDNSIIFGFERDHDLFQVKAINLAYDQKINLNYYTFSCPVLYARRHRPEEDFGSMNTLSFRQFWRISDKVKTPSRLEPSLE